MVDEHPDLGPGLRTGGTAVDTRGPTVDLARRMGTFDAFKATRLRLERSEFENADDVTERTM